MLHKIIKFFDKLEDKIRGFLSHYPIIYAIIGGTAIVLFWRGVWEISDELFGKEPLAIIVSLLLAMLTMLATGLFVSFFIGDRILISGIKHEKKVAEKTEEELKTDTEILNQIQQNLKNIELKIEQLEKKVDEII